MTGGKRKIPVTEYETGEQRAVSFGKRRKINPLTKRETREQIAVTFSKRRYGLFNKTAELCMLARCQAAIVVSSPASAETLYSFGHSSVDTVFDAYLNNSVPDAVDKEAAVSSAIALYNEIKELEHEPEEQTEKNIKRYDEIDHGFWWDSEDLGKYESIGELQVIVDSLEKLRENAFIRMNNLLSSDLSASGSSAAIASASNVDFDCKQLNFGNNVYIGNNNNSAEDNKEINKIDNALAYTLQEPDFGAVTKNNSGPQDVAGNNKFGEKDGNQANEIGAASGSNYAYIDENYARGVHNRQEADSVAIIQEVTGLEYIDKQDYFQNLLTMDFKIGNNVSPWSLFDEAMHYADHPADCAADQNYHANPADQYSKPTATATANEFGKLLACNKT